MPVKEPTPELYLWPYVLFFIIYSTLVFFYILIFVQGYAMNIRV